MWHSHREDTLKKCIEKGRDLKYSKTVRSKNGQVEKEQNVGSNKKFKVETYLKSLINQNKKLRPLEKTIISAKNIMQRWGSTCSG